MESTSTRRLILIEPEVSLLIRDMRSLAARANAGVADAYADVCLEVELKLYKLHRHVAQKNRCVMCTSYRLARMRTSRPFVSLSARFALDCCSPSSCLTFLLQSASVCSVSLLQVAADRKLRGKFKVRFAALSDLTSLLLL